MYLAHRPVITVNKLCKTYDVLRSKCTGTIGDSKPAQTCPYDELDMRKLQVNTEV